MREIYQPLLCHVKLSLVVKYLLSLILTSLDILIFPTVVLLVTQAVSHQDLNELYLAVIWAIIGSMAYRLANFMKYRYFYQLLYQFNQSVRDRCFEAYLAEAVDEGFATSFLMKDVEALERGYIEPVLMVPYLFFLSCVAAIYMLVLDWQIALVFIVSGLLPGLIARFQSRKLVVLGENYQQSKEAFVAKTSELLPRRSVMVHYKRQSFFKGVFHHYSQDMEAKLYLKERQQAVINLWTWLSFDLFKYLPLVVGSLIAIQNHSGIAILIAIYLASNDLIIPAKDALFFYGEYQANTSLVDKLRQLIRSPIEAQAPIVGDFPVHFEGVSLTYGAKPVLTNLNFTLEKGEQLLVTGASGSGKTSLAKLLLGQLVPTQGVIKTVSHIGYIRQEAVVFDGDLAFNITLGEPYPEEVIRAVLNQVGLHAFTLDYPLRHDGDNFSGGEKQRLEIARALIRQPDLIIADEPVSSLDEAHASMILNLLLDLPQSLVIISHQRLDELASRVDKQIDLPG